MTPETTEQRVARIASTIPLNDKNSRYEIIEIIGGVALIITDGVEHTRTGIPHDADEEAITKAIKIDRMVYGMREGC